LNLNASQDFSRKVVAELKKIRLRKGISQNALALKAGLSRAAIQHIEKEIRNPTLILLHAVAAALGVSLGRVIHRLENRRGTP
jgi:transcriptional regulator with XRE-family HTH domain